MAEINLLIEKVNQSLKEILQNNLVGVYYHGSLRLGGYNSNISDVDLIIVIYRKMNRSVKKAICEFFLRNRDLFPKKGFEFSVVLKKYCKSFIYPTPYELHLSEAWIDRYQEEPELVLNDNEKVDYDLASHFHVLKNKASFLDFGVPLEEVFGDVPLDDVVNSNYRDIEEAKEQIQLTPMYTILNLCRFYALIKDNLTLSKLSGGKWALEKNYFSYPTLIEYALSEYTSQGSIEYDSTLLDAFAEDALEKIKECMEQKIKLKQL